jgi:hypothetical protein
MTKLVPVAMAVSALAAATAMGLASPAFSQGGASLAQYGPPQSPGIGPNGDPRYGLSNESPGEVYNACRLVSTHRRGPNGSVTVRRRICY